MFTPTRLFVTVLLGVCTANSILAQSVTKEGVDNTAPNTAGNTGEGIASRRSAGGNQFGLDFFTGFTS